MSSFNDYLQESLGFKIISCFSCTGLRNSQIYVCAYKTPKSVKKLNLHTNDIWNIWLHIISNIIMY